MEPDCPQLAEVTKSGWTNGYMVKKWLETVFDPQTRDVPAVTGTDSATGDIGEKRGYGQGVRQTHLT